MLEGQGDLIRFHPRILEFAGHYHFAAKPVAVARGNEKGRVERRIRDLREAFFAARTFGSRADLSIDSSIPGYETSPISLSFLATPKSASPRWVTSEGDAPGKLFGTRS